jgi:aminoglycoside phosphotransferase (APT) family kinase protein
VNSPAPLLDADSARRRAGAVLRDIWPEWTGTLTALRPIETRLPALPFRVTGWPVPAVVKVWAPDLADKAARQAARQTVVADGMGADGPYRAARVLHFSADACALVMQDCSGQDFEEAMEQADTTRAERLTTQAGAWIAAHHQLSLRQAPLRPAGHLRWLDRLVRMGESGERDIPDLPLFRQEVAGMHRLFDAVRRRPTIRAVVHNDMNAGNLLISADGAIWGIDFENDKEDDPLRDLFALGVEICAFSAFGQDRPRALDCLTSGYGEQRGDPLVRLFLQRTFSLGLWARTPNSASYRQQARFVVAQWILSQQAAVL